MFSTMSARLAAQRQATMFDDGPGEFALTAQPGPGLVWDDNGKPATVEAAIARRALGRPVVVRGTEAAVQAFCTDLQAAVSDLTGAASS